jgi:alkylation response protein AidB-like acyl-CoA dehydrogenase
VSDQAQVGRRKRRFMNVRAASRDGTNARWLGSKSALGSAALCRHWHSAEGALDELIAHANAGRQQLKPAAPMRQSEVFQFELGRIAAELRAARAYHDMQVASHWHHALAGTLKDEALHAQGTQAGAWIATTCVHLTDACFTLAGGSAVYESSPQQRRMRDLRAAAQHAAVHQKKRRLPSCFGARRLTAQSERRHARYGGCDERHDARHHSHLRASCDAKECEGASD